MTFCSFTGVTPALATAFARKSFTVAVAASRPSPIAFVNGDGMNTNAWNIRMNKGAEVWVYNFDASAAEAGMTQVQIIRNCMAGRRHAVFG